MLQSNFYLKRTVYSVVIIITYGYDVLEILSKEKQKIKSD